MKCAAMAITLFCKIIIPLFSSLPVTIVANGKKCNRDCFYSVRKGQVIKGPSGFTFEYSDTVNSVLAIISTNSYNFDTQLQ